MRERGREEFEREGVRGKRIEGVCKKLMDLLDAMVE